MDAHAYGAPIARVLNKLREGHRRSIAYGRHESGHEVGQLPAERGLSRFNGQCGVKRSMEDVQRIYGESSDIDLYARLKPSHLQVI
jgi:hypothetical protein